MTTESKLALLTDIFPQADKQALLEILVSCQGSLKQAELLLDEQFERHPAKRRKIPAKQTTLSSIPATTSTIPLGVIPAAGSNRAVILHSKEDVEATIPYASLYHDFLPDDLAQSLLESLMRDNDGFVPNEFHLFGNKCKSNHLTKLYTTDLAENRQCNIQYNGSGVRNIASYNTELKIAQLLIEELTNKEIAKRQSLPFQHKGEWKANVAVCNKFNNKSNNLDWHSDRLTYIGPHCTVVSLSLGAMREFRVRKQYSTDGAGPSTIYSIPLYHNTLLIMHAGFQEEYKHCVSSTTELELHPTSGPLRINLTYRHYLDKYRRDCPICDRCGCKMDLRRSYKDAQTRSRYIWTCSGNYLGRSCNGFHYAKFDDESLFTDNVDECSKWLSKDDHEALKFFRLQISKQLQN